MIIYKWTGEYRPPKKDEWYLVSLDEPIGAMVAENDVIKTFSRWILNRQDIPDPAPEVDDG